MAYQQTAPVSVPLEDLGHLVDLGHLGFTDNPKFKPGILEVTDTPSNFLSTPGGIFTILFGIAVASALVLFLFKKSMQKYYAKPQEDIVNKYITGELVSPDQADAQRPHKHRSQSQSDTSRETPPDMKPRKKKKSQRPPQRQFSTADQERIHNEQAAIIEKIQGDQKTHRSVPASHFTRSMPPVPAQERTRRVEREERIRSKSLRMASFSEQSSPSRSRHRRA